MQKGSVKNQNLFSKKILSIFFGRQYWNLLWLINNFESRRILHFQDTLESFDHFVWALVNPMLKHSTAIQIFFIIFLLSAMYYKQFIAGLQIIHVCKLYLNYVKLHSTTFLYIASIMFAKTATTIQLCNLSSCNMVAIFATVGCIYNKFSVANIAITQIVYSTTQQYLQLLVALQRKQD